VEQLLTQVVVVVHQDKQQVLLQLLVLVKQVVAMVVLKVEVELEVTEL
tara:strand:+ start:300 stop:443 length:144 start_codon:yes stop_codon:yes gene_type:complete